MAQISYGTITITDTNDIESIVVEYNRNQSTLDAPAQNDSGWSTTRPAWASGYYIWQRTRTHKSGTATTEDEFGTAVCITGSAGQIGETGQSLTATKTQYTNVASGVTITTDNHSSYTWTDNVPNYDSSKPIYWGRVTNTYSNPSKTEYIVYRDGGLTDAIAKSVEANENASEALDKANEAQQTVIYLDNLLGGHFMHGSALSQSTPASARVIERIKEGNTDVSDTPSKWLHNVIIGSTGIALRYNEAVMAQLAANQSSNNTALRFYQPPTIGSSTTTQGALTVELNDNALKFYNPSTGSAQMVIGANGTLQSGNYTYRSDLAEKRFSVSGTKIDLTNGDIITPYFRLSSGSDSVSTGAYIHGTIEALDGFIQKLYIGTNATNRWEIGNFINYDQSTSAALISKGNAFIQLGNLNTWRLSTDRIHTAWISENSTVLTFPRYDNKYWDWGIHSPHKDADTIWKDKFLYIRNAPDTTALSALASDLDDDTGLWTYQFYIDRNGNVHAPAYYVGDEPLTGGVGSIAEKIINSDSTYGKGSVTKPIYIDSNGRPAETTYSLNAAGAKGVVTSISADSSDLPTVTAVKNYISGLNYVTSSGVISVTIGATSPVQSSTSAAQTGASVSTTISLKDGYGDTKNPYASKTKNYVLAAPSSADGVPSFRKLVTADIPDLSDIYLTSYTETDPIFVASAAYGITSSDISNWNSKTSNTGTVTKVTAGTGLKIGTATSGGDITTTGTINHINSVTAKTAAAQSAKTLTWGGTFTLYEEKYDAQGHVTDVASYNMTMPANPNTHNTAYLYAGKSDGTANAATTNGNTYLILMDGGSATTRRKISGSGTVSVASDANGNITITGSAHPTSLKNPNALTVNVYNATTQTTSGYSTTTYDGSVANQSISVAGNNAITKITSNENGQLVVQRASGATPETVTVKITATTSDTSASADKLNLSADVGSSTQPVYFNGNTGLPVATTYSLNKTVPSTAEFTDTWIAMVGATSSANGTAGYVSAPPKDGYNTKFLRADGTWVIPGGTYSLPLAANGTRGGVQIGYSANGKNYPVQLSSEKMYVNVPWTDTNYYHKTGSWSGLTYTAGKVGSPDDLVFTLPTGTTSTTILRGDHTYATSIEKDTSTTTSQLILAYGTKYKLTTGGTNYIFTMPASDNTNTTYELSGALSSHKFTSTLTAGGSGSGTSTSDFTLAAGDNITLTDNTSTRTITIKANDTTYESKTAASGGTAVSLVTTGEKYTWNNKQDKLTNPVTGTGTSGYLVKWSGNTSVTSGPQLGSSTTTYLRNDGSWSTPINTDTKMKFTSTSTNAVYKVALGPSSITSGNDYEGYYSTNLTYNPSTNSFVINSGEVRAKEAVFEKLIATNASITDTLTAQNATVVGLLDVQGQLHANSWTNSNIATIDGSFFITPTVSIDYGTFTYSTSGNGQITLNGVTKNNTTYTFGIDSNWTSGSLVMLTGQVAGSEAMMPLGTIRGTLSSATANRIIIKGPFSDGEGNPCATLSTIGAKNGVDGEKLKVSLYQKKLSNGLAPLGIYMTSGGYNTQNTSFIDIYGGGELTSTAPTTNGVYSGAFAKPVLRIGNLSGMPILTNTAVELIPTGYGIYTTNGYFEGIIASTKGYIGGFTIGESDLNNGALGSTNSVWVSTGKSDSTSIGGSEGINNWAFTAGSQFGVTTDGTLYASNGIISGSVRIGNSVQIGSTNSTDLSMLAANVHIEGTGSISLGDQNGFHIFIDGSDSKSTTYGIGFYQSNHNKEYVETTDTIPQTDKNYYTKDGNNNYTKFSGNTFVTGTTYYEEIDKRIAYLNNQQLFIPRTVVLKEMRIGSEWTWERNDFTKNLTLKWRG